MAAPETTTICPVCEGDARWVGDPADSGFMAYCESCDRVFTAVLPPLTDA